MSDAPDVKISKNMQPIVEQLETQLSDIAGEPTAFFLLVFNPNDKGSLNFGANIDINACFEVMDDLKDIDQSKIRKVSGVALH